MTTTIIEQSDILVKFEVEVGKSDYQDRLQKEIKKLAKSVSIPGFRQGHAPVGMVKKMYGDKVRFDVINDIVSDQVNNVIEEKELKLMTPPVPEQGNDEVVSEDDFKLQFSAPLRPSNIDDDLSDAPKLTKYKVEVGEDDVKKELEDLQKRHPRLVDKDLVDAQSTVHGDIGELDGDVLKEGGLQKDGVSQFIALMNDAGQDKFVGSSRGSVVIFEPRKVFDSEYQVARMLGVDKESVAQYEGVEFSFQIEAIQNEEPALLDQEFFDKVFDEGTVTNEEEALARIKEMMQKRQEERADYLVNMEMLKYLKSEKAPKIELAEDLLYTYYAEQTIRSHQEKNNDEVLNLPSKDQLMKDLRESIYINRLAELNEVEVKSEDIFTYGMMALQSQFSQMGFPALDQSLLVELTQRRFKEDRNFSIQIEEAVTETFLAKKLQEKLSLTEEQVTIEQLDEIFEKLQSHSSEEEHDEASTVATPEEQETTHE